MIGTDVQTGPRLMTEHPAIFWGLIARLCIGDGTRLMLNIPLIGIWVKMLQFPNRILYPAILLFICIGVFGVNNHVFDISVVLFFGMLGCLLMLVKFEPAPLILGFIPGPLMEEHLRRAMLIPHGDPMMSGERLIAASLLAPTLLLLAWAVFSLVRGNARRAAKG